MTQERESQRNEAGLQPASQGYAKQVVKALPHILPKLPFMLKRIRRMEPDEERYVRPRRPYELPEYREGMKYCTSNEPYLRRVQWCNPHDHNVIAMAHELGSCELSDREYAEAAYWWLKDNMWYEFSDWYGAGETLRRGVGACLHLANVYIALCRCAGIKSRFKGFKMYMSPSMKSKFFALEEEFADFWDTLGGVVPELEAEVFVDGTWMTAYTPQPSALTAATNGWPITEFGESGTELYFDVVPGSVKRFEALSLRLGMNTKLVTMLMPAVTERLNVGMSRRQMRGRQNIEDAGGIEGYNRMARRKREQFSPEEIISKRVRERPANIIRKRPDN